MKKTLIVFLLVFATAAAAVIFRYEILIPLATTGEPVALNPQAPTVPGSTPFEDNEVYVILQIDAQTYAIAEPYTWTRNFNYLFVGEERALLFDAGIGHYDIRPVVASLTDLPVTFLLSHFHYDHTGQVPFERRAMLDVPHIRAQANGDQLKPSWAQFLGSAEGIDIPIWEISEWVKPGQHIDLGGRRLRLLFTPGHTDNSVSLYDHETQRLYSGDFISKNQINAYYPGGSLGDYVSSADTILTETSPATKIYGAHAQEDPDLPVFDHYDVTVLRDQIRRIKSGELAFTGLYPVSYQITPAQVLQAEHPWLQNWELTPPR